jgi:hypothetical protein
LPAPVSQLGQLTQRLLKGTVGGPARGPVKGLTPTASPRYRTGWYVRMATPGGITVVPARWRFTRSAPFQQAVHKVVAAIHDQVLSGLLLELGDALRDIAVDQVGVLPFQVLERG